MRCAPGAVLARPLHDLKDPNEFEPREQDQAAQTAGLAPSVPARPPGLDHNIIFNPFPTADES